jgi:hypothetical protein
MTSNTANTATATPAPAGTPFPGPAWADAFVARWFADWNAHDADAIAAHYHPDVEYHSPFVAQLTGQPHLVGHQAVHDYVAAALERFPDLHFDPPEVVAVGAGSVAFTYTSVNGLRAVETLVIGDDGLVRRAHCHYR